MPCGTYVAITSSPLLLPSSLRAAQAAGSERLRRGSSKLAARRPAAAAAARPRAGVVDYTPPGRLADALALSPQPPPPRPRPQQEDTWSLEDATGVLEVDENKEQGRRHMRELSTFTFRRWAFHRSTSRYVRHMSGIFQSRIVRGLAQPLLSSCATATIVCVYEQALQDGWLPSFLPTFIMPSLPFDITASSLGLLLVFRTNSSYDRWQQAVSAWGDIETRARDTLRQLLAAASHSSAGHGGARQAALSAASAGRWLVAFSRSLKAQLTEDSDVQAELREVLTGQELALLLGAQHRPSFALAVLSELAEAAPLRDAQRVRVDENLSCFQDAAGRCERILRTPIPLSYTRHSSRFMVIWLSALPLGLWSQCGFGTIPLTVIISFLLLGIEEIGVAIEEPFSILPLDDMCRELEFGLSDILEQSGSSKRAAREAAAAAAAAVAAGLDGARAAGSAAGGGIGAAAAAASSSGAAASAAAEVEASNVAPFLPGALGRGRGSEGPREPMSAASIFLSFDEADA